MHPNLKYYIFIKELSGFAFLIKLASWDLKKFFIEAVTGKKRVNFLSLYLTVLILAFFLKHSYNLPMCVQFKMMCLLLHLDWP